MTEALLALTGIGQEGLFALFVVFLRVGAVMALLPAFGELTVPRRIRLGLAIAFTVIVAPVVAPVLPGTPEASAWLAVGMPAEIAIGLLLGIGVRLFVLALQTAGTMAAQATSLSQIFGGSSGVDPQPAIAHLLVLAGLALAVLADLHLRVAEALVLSYELFPPGRLPEAAAVADWGTSRVAEAFALAFTLSAPFVVASVIYNVALGAINRAMPQLMVAFVGAPALTWGGLVLLLLAVPAMLQLWLAALHGFLGDPLGGAP